jgi:hypothetical protein
MKIVLFTSSGLRHRYLINQILKSGHKLIVFQENIPTNTQSGSNLDSNEMIEYFKLVKEAEKSVFSCFDVYTDEELIHSIPFGQLSSINLNNYIDIQKVDLFLVFGSSWIKDPLVEHLINADAINLHMGVSPYFRGTACNYWAQKLSFNDLIGGTVHYLDRGLDSGDIIKQVTLSPGVYDKFKIGMLAVKETIDYLVQNIDKIKKISSFPQDKSKTIKYSRKIEFTKELAKEFVSDYMSNKMIKLD